MTLRLYMDVNVPHPITKELRLQGIDVLTAQEDGGRTLTDAELLSRASGLGRIVVSFDTDLLREAARRSETGEAFAGVIYAHQQDISIGRCVQDLTLLATVEEREEWVNRVVYLPL